jgi:hypothetical protein
MLLLNAEHHWFMGLSVLLSASLFVYSSFPSTRTVFDDWTTILSCVANEMDVLPSNSNWKLQILMSHTSHCSMVHQSVCETCYRSVTENPRLRRRVLRFSKWVNKKKTIPQEVWHENVTRKHNLKETDVYVKVILKLIFSNHILRRNCLLRQVIEGKIKGG